MNREQAMDKAVEIVEKWSVAPVKANGYTVDGWKAPTLSEKVEAVNKLADFLWEVEDVKTVEVRTVDGQTQEINFDATREE